MKAGDYEVLKTKLFFARHNVPLAERVLAEARKAGCASVVVYSALMRVYAMSRLFHKTCDLYATLREDGLEPDTIMYGSLIKAAVECGRLDLSPLAVRIPPRL